MVSTNPAFGSSSVRSAVMDADWSQLNPFEYKKLLEVLTLQASWGCETELEILFRMSNYENMTQDRKSSARKAIWLSLVSHPHAILLFATKGDHSNNLETLKKSIQENRSDTVFNLTFLKKLVEKSYSPEIRRCANLLVNTVDVPVAKIA